jgi:PAS domain S-box-containing protein
VVTIDSASLVTGWSPQAGTIFGWTHREVPGYSPVEIIIPERYREALAEVTA